MNQHATVFIDSLSEKRNPDQTIEAKGSQFPQNGFLDTSGGARVETLHVSSEARARFGATSVRLLSQATSSATRGFRKVERSPIGRDEHRNPDPSTRSMQALPGELLTEWPRMHKELQQYTRELQASEVRFRQMIEKNADGILIVNQEGIIRFVNPAAEALFDRQAEELVGEGFGFPVTAGETTEIDIVRRPLPVRAGGSVVGELGGLFLPTTQPSNYPTTSAGGGGETAVAEMRVVEIEWEGESGYLASLRDITERKRMEAELENAQQFERHLAYHDALTGLPNRLLFYDRLRQSMAQAKRHRQLAALLFLDLDGFKRINDTLGHSVGDLLLQSVAGRLCDCLRETDTVARLGGDEFTVILNDMTQAQGAATVAQKILNVLSNLYVLKGYELVITASIGISLYPSDGTDVESLVRSADTAMYRAKEQGKNTYRLYNMQMSK